MTLPISPMLITPPGDFSAADELLPAPAVDELYPIEGLAELIFTPPQLHVEHAIRLPAPALLASEPVRVVDEPELSVADADPVDPQQWLAVMLDQQSVQLEARDYVGSLARSPEPRSAEGGQFVLSSGAADELLAERRALPGGVRTLPVSDTPPVSESAEEPPIAKGLWALLDKRETAAPAPASPVSAMASAESSARALPASVTLTDSALAAAARPVDGLAQSVPLTAPASAAPATGFSEPVLERELKLMAPQARWGEQMLHTLRETVEVQIQQRFQQATIRLDPPELGSLEIFISHESGRLSVHISAAQTDVARLLHNTSERLRQELLEHNALEVQVQVSSDAQGHSQREQSRQQHEPDRVMPAADTAPATTARQGRDSNVLVTV